MGRYDGAHGRGNRIGLAFDEAIGRGHASEGEVADFTGIVAASDIDQHFADAAAYGGFGAHGIGPETIDLSGFESPRGKIYIDAQTRDIVQDIYLRKVEKKDGQLFNVEFDVIKDVKDPGKAK